MKFNATKFCLNTELKPKIQTENENENFSVAENVGFSNFFVSNYRFQVLICPITVN